MNPFGWLQWIILPFILVVGLLVMAKKKASRRAKWLFTVIVAALWLLLQFSLVFWGNPFEAQDLYGPPPLYGPEF
ncbi:MAG: hypothetical protein FWG40_05585 [Peptococcaceae bacterium]|nr:hypothetical protein [Peptococcaceae bacterium]